jgi:uncharacterized protein
MIDRIFADEIYVPTFKVKLIKINEMIEKNEITGLKIEEDLENPGVCTISFHEDFNVDTQEFRWLDNDDIAPGAEILAYFGYAFPETQGTFKGKIKALEPAFALGGVLTLDVQAFDHSHSLQKTYTKLKKDTDVTYQDVAQEIAQGNGLSFSGGENVKLIVYKKVDRDVNQKDHEFLKKLAEKIGFEFFVRNKTLYFRKPEEDKTPELVFELNNNIISFSPRLSTASVTKEVKVTAWSEKEKKEISETARISDLKSCNGIKNFEQMVDQANEKKEAQVKVEGRVVRSREEAKDIALSELKRRNGGFITGNLECAGDSKLRPGITVNVINVGTLLSGPYYIKKASHTFGENGYRTTLELKRCL